MGFSQIIICPKGHFLKTIIIHALKRVAIKKIKTITRLVYKNKILRYKKGAFAP